MKKVLLIFVIALSFNGYGFSQQNETLSIQDRVVKSMQKITSYIVLSDKQYTDLKKVFEKIYTDNEKAKEASRVSKENRENFESNLESILNVDQFHLYKEKQKQINDSIADSKLPPWKRKN